jgi:hypothetical protein
MGKGQAVKLMSWITLVVLGPLTVYPAAWYMAGLQNKTISLQQLLELGDILILDLLLLFGMIDMLVQAAQVKGYSKKRGELGLIDYVSVAASFLFILIIAPIYGSIILDRLGILKIVSTESLAWLYGLSYPGFAFFCGSRYYRLLRLNLV